MCNIESTIHLLKEMSRCTDPGTLVRLYFNHLRQSADVQRALILSKAGLSHLQYRLLDNLHGSNGMGGSVLGSDAVREGGLLARLLYGGEFQHITPFAPDPADPAFEVLRGSASLIAVPLFDNGICTGMVVILGSSPRPHTVAELCTLATESSLLGRAIEAQKAASELQAACRALDHELQAAADVQRWLLPRSTPAIAGASIAASYRTARRSGGDYYDTVELPDGRLGVLIADVSGKGAGAAVLMAVLRTILHELDLARITGPAAFLDYADGRLCALGLAERATFVTAFACAFDPASGTLTYSSAGHNPPRLLRAHEGAILPLDEAGAMPLGLLDQPCAHSEVSAVLNPGDLALFYTDGITEARSPQNEFFGTEHLDQVLLSLPRPLTASSTVGAVAEAVRAFEQVEAPSDDQTLLAVGRPAGRPAVRRTHPRRLHPSSSKSSTRSRSRGSKETCYETD